MKRFAFGIICAVNLVPASAASPWDGEWYVDRAVSHTVPASFNLSRSAAGAWTYADGDDEFVFAADNGSVAARFRADVAITAIRLDGRHFDYVESTFGRETARRHMTLAADGKSLSVRAVDSSVEGKTSSSDSVAVRVGLGMGLQGTWVTSPESGTRGAAQPKETAVMAPERPAVVIFTGTNGMMTWYFPATGEVIRGKADGRRRPITGPLIPSNLTFTWNRAGQSAGLVFSGSYGAHLVGTAIEQLSADGATLTDTFTVAGATVSSVFVMHKK